MANSFRNLPLWFFLVSVIGTFPVARAQIPDITVQKALPIDLDADASEFDRRNDKLLFRGLRITQGTLHIEADAAEADQLDFDNSRWTFTGNVVIENVGTKAFCDYAEIHFKAHQVDNAMMRGEPARFNQKRLKDDKVTQGHSEVMEYDLQAGLIRMSDDAWLSDGANEVSGNRITYDLIKEFVIADADESGQVKMKIIPTEQELRESGIKSSP